MPSPPYYGGLFHGRDISSSHPLARICPSYWWEWVAQNNRKDYPVILYLYKNGKRIEEAQHYSDEVGISGSMLDQGGRTLLVYLGEGDTLALHCENCMAGIYATTFCVSLSTFDIV